MSDKKTTLKIEFANEESAREFALWLCESGEQEYWDWMEEREMNIDGDITAIAFDYHGNSKDFLGDAMTIRTKSGRLAR